MEYLLSSPFTKSGILIKKFIPRLIILLFLVLFYSLILNIHNFSGIIKNRTFLELPQIIFIIITIFFCSVFLSLYEWGNIKGLVWLIIIFPVFNLNLILHHIFDKNIVINNNIILSVNTLNLSLMIITIILGIGFFFVFRNFDIKSSKIFKKKIALISGIPLIIIIIISFIIGITQNI